MTKLFSRQLFEITRECFYVVVSFRILITIDVILYSRGNWELIDEIPFHPDLLKKRFTLIKGADVHTHGIPPTPHFINVCLKLSTSPAVTPFSRSLDSNFSRPSFLHSSV